MKVVRTTLALGMALAAMSAQAQFVDGNKLLRFMQGDAMDRVHGYGYVSGVYDVMKNVMFCPPTNVTVGQVNDMVKIFLEQNPQHRSLIGDEIVVHVLKTAWPCKKGSGV